MKKIICAILGLFLGCYVYAVDVTPVYPTYTARAGEVASSSGINNNFAAHTQWLENTTDALAELEALDPDDHIFNSNKLYDIPVGPYVVTPTAGQLLGLTEVFGGGVKFGLVDVEDELPWVPTPAPSAYPTPAPDSIIRSQNAPWDFGTDSASYAIGYTNGVGFIVFTNDNGNAELKNDDGNYAGMKCDYIALDETGVAYYLAKSAATYNGIIATTYNGTPVPLVASDFILAGTNEVILQNNNGAFRVVDSDDDELDIEVKQIVSAENTRPPMIINSTTMVDNLNADMVDGYDASSFYVSGQNGAVFEADFYVRDTDEDTVIHVEQDGDIVISGDATPYAYFDRQNHYFGIGAAPQAPLHVTDTTNIPAIIESSGSDPTLYIYNSNAYNNANTIGISLRVKDSSSSSRAAGQIIATMHDTTSSSKDSTIELKTYKDNTLATRFTIKENRIGYNATPSTTLNHTFTGSVVNTSYDIVIADNGIGSSQATQTIDPTLSVVFSLQCEDPDGATITISETGAVEGQELAFFYDKNSNGGSCDFSNITNQQKFVGGNARLRQTYETFRVMYFNGVWVQSTSILSF